MAATAEPVTVTEKVTEAEMKFLCAVLQKSQTKLAIDWKDVAKDLGFTRPDNAQSKFREVARKLRWAAYTKGGNSISPRKKEVSKDKVPRTPTKNGTTRVSGRGHKALIHSPVTTPEGTPMSRFKAGSCVRKETRSPHKKVLRERGKRVVELERLGNDEDDDDSLDIKFESGQDDAEDMFQTPDADMDYEDYV